MRHHLQKLRNHAITICIYVLSKQNIRMGKGTFFWFNAAFLGYLMCEKTAKYLEYNLLQNLLRIIWNIVGDINWPLSTFVQIPIFSYSWKYHVTQQQHAICIVVFTLPNRYVKPPQYYVIPTLCIWLYSIKRIQTIRLVVYLWILRRNPHCWYTIMWCSYRIISGGKTVITENTRSSTELTSVLKVEPKLFC